MRQGGQGGQGDKEENLIMPFLKTKWIGGAIAYDDRCSLKLNHPLGWKGWQE